MEKHLLKEKLDLLETNIAKAVEQLELPKMKSEVEALEAEMSQPGFWDDQETAQKVVARLKVQKDLYETWSTIESDAKNLAELFEEIDSKEYPSFVEEIELVENEFEKASFVLYFSGEYDKNGVIFTIKAGAGGDDAEDFAGMLLRMYTMYFEKQGFKASVHEHSPGAGAEGIKKAVLEVEGPYCYGNLKGEKGVHRLVRLSPFKSSDSRQTSFASVDVMPLMDDMDKSEIEVKEEDLRVDTYRSSGSGGQKVNKTDSAVRITHIPSGIVVSCQVERSQHANRDRAMKVLKNKLWQEKQEELAKERKELQGEMVSVDWGKQIRSYVLHPYKMVKDHRTDVEVSQVEQVLDGYLEPFIEAEVQLYKGKK